MRCSMDIAGVGAVAASAPPSSDVRWSIVRFPTPVRDAIRPCLAVATLRVLRPPQRRQITAQRPLAPLPPWSVRAARTNRFHQELVVRAGRPIGAADHAV